MRFVNALLNAAGDLVLGGWHTESPWPPLAAGSFVAAFVLVALFRVSSDQPAILRARNRLIARVLELLLFRHDFRMSLSACGRILGANLYYLRQFAVPTLVAFVPVMLIFVQLAGWFEARPLRVGEAALLEIELDPAHPVMETPVALSVSDTLHVETDAVRIPVRNELCWRVRACQEGVGWATAGLAGSELRKEIVVGRHVTRASSRRPQTGFWQELLHPAEPPLPREGVLLRIDLRYPVRQLLLGDAEVNWLVASLVLIMIFGLVLGKLLGVRLG